MKKILSILFLLSGIQFSYGQELNCQVQVLSPQIQGTTEKHIFETLQKAIFEFMNNTKWTNDVFDVTERISCNLTLTIATKVATDEYSGSLQIQSSRPVFKTSYSSVLINHNDPDIQFKYVEYQPLDFSISSNLSNLTSVLAFYAYVIIAQDYDTYSLYGGTPYWTKAQTIVSNAQTAAEKGWKSMDGTKNRFWIADNPLQPTYAPMRECMYKYHRLGLDVMYSDVNGGRAACLDALNLLEKVHDAKPLSFAMQFFFNAKVDEVVNLFSGGLPDEKSKVVILLQKIDPGHGIQWQKITQSQ
ncbi:MAG TPA: DUF4835 family protein [Bacteroidia bacterium]|jgi:hypothetical protein|nr:DUF4835 family protein [Bacteroidia bacterium]